jgi:hypothetical protein
VDGLFAAVVPAVPTAERFADCALGCALLAFADAVADGAELAVVELAGAELAAAAGASAGLGD